MLYGASHAPAKGGDESQRFQGFSGTRVKLGYVLGESQRAAIEATGFFLGRQSAGFEARSDSAGNPVLGIPVRNSVAYSIAGMTIRPGEDSLPFSLPDSADRARSNGIITGGIKISNRLQLWGAEATGVFSFHRKKSWDLSGLLGYLLLAGKYRTAGPAMARLLNARMHRTRAGAAAVKRSILGHGSK